VTLKKRSWKYEQKDQSSLTATRFVPMKLLYSLSVHHKSKLAISLI